MTALTLSSDCRPAHHAAYTPDSLTHALVNAIATATDTPPLEVPPLYDTIDPEALEHLLIHHRENTDPVVISFTIDAVTITVHGDGRILITDETTPVCDHLE